MILSLELNLTFTPSFGRRMVGKLLSSECFLRRVVDKGGAYHWNFLRYGTWLKMTSRQRVRLSSFGNERQRNPCNLQAKVEGDIGFLRDV